MKIQAKDLKVGDVISDSVMGPSVITDIEERYQKNGKMYFFVIVTYSPKFLNGKRNLEVKHEGALSLKPETKINRR